MKKSKNDKLFKTIKASGILPHGTAGECLFERISKPVEVFAETVKANINKHNKNSSIDENILKPLEVELDISGYKLTGKINNIYSLNMINYRYAKLKAKDIISFWIYHLVLNTIQVDNYPKTSKLFGLKTGTKGKINTVLYDYSPVKKSLEILNFLLNKYWVGLSLPLSFFPETSYCYAEQVIEKNKSDKDALYKAKKIWLGTDDYTKGEFENDYYQLCFKQTDPLNHLFEKNAMEILKPVFEHQKIVIC
jgi:exodeoxyribonuclease V gamma subunit